MSWWRTSSPQNIHRPLLNLFLISITYPTLQALLLWLIRREIHRSMFPVLYKIPVPVSLTSPLTVNQTSLSRMLIRHSKYVSKTQNTAVSWACPERVKQSTVSFLHFNPHSLIYLRSLLTKLLGLKSVKSAMIWNFVLIKFKLSVASTRSKIIR